MKKLNYAAILISLLFIILSCNEDISVTQETTEVAQLSAETLINQSLNEINDPLLLAQLLESEKN